MKTIAIVVAMQKEFDLVLSIVEQPHQTRLGGCPCAIGYIGQNSIILLKSGIGKVNAAIQVTELIAKYSPNYIINSGVAGGIDTSLRQADIVAAANTAYHDVWCGGGHWGQVQGLPLLFPADQHLIDTIKKINNPNIKIGLTLTGDQFITDNQQLQHIKETFPQGLAVDMESAAMAHVCYIQNTPFLSLRIISDTPGSDKDNATQYNDFFANAPQQTFKVLQELIKLI